MKIFGGKKMGKCEGQKGYTPNLTGTRQKGRKRNVSKKDWS